jgi:hypothetical protein
MLRSMLLILGIFLYMAFPAGLPHKCVASARPHGLKIRNQEGKGVLEFANNTIKTIR